MHLVVPRHGNTDVLSNSSQPHCWAATVKETHTEGGARAPPGERAKAPFSLLCSLLVTGSNIPPGLEADP